METELYLKGNHDYPYYQEAKPDYHQYNHHHHHPSFNSEVPTSTDFSFLPENSLYDTVIGSPLDATRQSTDATDASDSEINQVDLKTYPQYHQQQLPPVYQNYQFQNLPITNSSNNMRNPFFQNVNHNFQTHFQQIPPQQINHYTCGNPLDHNLPQVQSTQTPLLNQQMMMFHYTQQIGKSSQMNELEREKEEEDEEEEVDNPQLKSLIDFNIWSNEKDELLLKLGTQHKFDWKKIAKKFSHKRLTPHFLKTRYKELTCAPVQRRMKFNHKEDLMIAKYFEKYGSNWAQMSIHFENRTAIMLKNRYYSFIRKRDLLPILLTEIRDIEKENLDVDHLGVQEAEKYANSLELKMAYEQNGHQAYRKMDNVSLWNAHFGGTEIYTHLNKNQLNNSDNGHEKQRKEIEILKTKIKSLQSLFVITKAELDRLKKQNTN